MSAKLSPIACVRTTATPGLGCGSGRAVHSRTSGPPKREKVSACMAGLRGKHDVIDSGRLKCGPRTRHRIRRMLRLTDLKLPLDHPEQALRKAILARLGIANDELTGFTVAKRSYDARRRGAIVLIYSVDVDTPREADILRRLQLDTEAAAFARTGDGGKVMP